jgi:hypothetical protein
MSPQPPLVAWQALSDRDLLRAYADLMKELRTRGVIRSSNNPVADYAEKLVAVKLGLTLQAKSVKGHDALDAQGIRYEVKARRRTPENQSTQLSQLRGLDHKHFDYLVGVLFRPDFSVEFAAVIPHAVVLAEARFSDHTNAHVFHLRPSVAGLPGVRDVTSLLAT